MKSVPKLLHRPVEKSEENNAVLPLYFIADNIFAENATNGRAKLMEGIPTRYIDFF